MDEQKEETKEEKPEKPASNSDEGSKPEIYKPIDDANLAAKRMEEANKVKRELLDREESLAAKKALGGVTEAGQATIIKEESAIEYRDRIDKEISEGKHDD